MKLRNRRAATLVIFTFCVQIAISHDFISERLYQIATKVGVSADTSQPKGYYAAGHYNNRPLCIGISADHRVFHVGYKLFADDMKTQYPSEVYDFLERYLLELDCIGSEGILKQYLSDDGVRVLEGDLQNARYIDASTAFSFTRTDNTCYDIKWTDGTKTLLSMQFPISFELLHGVRKNELESMMHSILASEPSTYSPKEDAPTVEMLPDGYFRSSPLVTYQLESLNTASYYERNDSDALVPIYGDEQPEYSLRNLFRGMVECSQVLNITQNLYGYKQTNYTVSLAQWLCYCKEKGLRIYIGISQEQGNENDYKVFVVAQSDALAYNHLVTVIVPKDFIATPNATFSAKMNAFIPTHNIKAVYQETIKQ